MIRNDTVRYDPAYYTHVNTSSLWNLQTGSPKINRGILIVTVLTLLNVKESNETSLLNINGNGTNGGELLLTAKSPKY